MKKLLDGVHHPTINNFMFYDDAQRYSAEKIYWICNAIALQRENLKDAVSKR